MSLCEKSARACVCVCEKSVEYTERRGVSLVCDVVCVECTTTTEVMTVCPLWTKLGRARDCDWPDAPCAKMRNGNLRQKATSWDGHDRIR